MGRHGRHDHVRAPETKSQGPRQLEIEAGKQKTLEVHTTIQLYRKDGQCIIHSVTYIHTVLYRRYTVLKVIPYFLLKYHSYTYFS